jgi:23S rRNA (guanosine2251-2'-O)-methyltransferase
MKRRSVVNPGSAPPADARCVYGVHAVSEWLRARPTQLSRIDYDARSAGRLAALLASATTASVPLHPCAEDMLTRLAGTSRHQGVVATALPFPYVELEHALTQTPRLLIVADQIQDPHNLGALIRTAAAAGAGAVILPKDGSVPVTPTVEAAAAGAAAFVPVCRVTNAVRALRTLKGSGYWAVGLTPSRGIDLYQFDPPERVVVVIGGETGMRPLVERHCDFAVSIPMFGSVESLNASVAAAIVLYELRRRWGDWRSTAE